MAIKFEDLKDMTSSDQTGAFPHTSAKGNRYVMVMEDSDAEPIIATGIKSRKKNILLHDSSQYITLSRRQASTQ